MVWLHKGKNKMIKLDIGTPDTYIAVDNEIICGDCVRVMSMMPSGSIDFVCTSPPYDNIRTYGNDWDLDLHAVGKEMYRILKDGGVAVMVIQDQTKDFAKSVTSFRTIVDWCDIGFKLFECCIYQKHGRPGPWWNQRFRIDHEYIPIFFKGHRPNYFNKKHLEVPCKPWKMPAKSTTRLSDGRTINDSSGRSYDTKSHGTIFYYGNSSIESCSDKALKLQHPATYPDKLPEDFITCFCNPSGTVLDPFAGSATTLIAAKKLKRNFIGIEINPAYVAIGRERLEAVIPSGMAA